MNVPSSDTYVASVTLSGYTGSNKTVSVTCPAGASVTLTATPDANRHRFFAQSPCNFGGIPDVTLNINDGSYTTDSSGYAYYSVPAGTYAWTATSNHPGFQSASGSRIHSSCFSTNWGQLFTLTTGYHCVCSCTFPLDESDISLTDSIIGSTSLSWDGVNSFVGTIAGYSFGGFCGCPANTTDIEYGFAPSTCTVQVRYKSTGGWPGNCPDGGAGWAWLNLGTALITPGDCPDAFAGTAASAYPVCTCNGAGTDCTPTADRVYRLWSGSAPTFTVSQ